MTGASGLSRRGFLTATAALAGAWMLPKEFLAEVLAAPLRPSQAPTTLQQTIKLGPAVRNQWRNLVAGPGEGYLPRLDLLGRAPATARIKHRRSLLYFGHFSDIHIIDAQSPGRLEPLVAMSNIFVDATRPQDTMTVQVLAAMVESVTAAMESPLTGAPMAAAINTGDSADSMSSLELRWCIDMLDGKSVTPNSGAPGVYEGVQVWPEATYAYQPGNPMLDEYGTYGFPQLDGVLNAAVGQEVHSVGLPVPWYTVYGNHDSLFAGNMQPGEAFREWALGTRKDATWPATAANMANGFDSSLSAFQRIVHRVQSELGMHPGVRTVTADQKRTVFDQLLFMKEHLASPSLPGPVGHGFTPVNLKSGETWWKADLGPLVRVFGLDTCSQVAGSDGAVPESQFSWLKSELRKATEENKLCIVTSHHNSETLDNLAEPTIGPEQKLYQADAFVAMLHEFPNMIVWLNGHTHINTITAHPKAGGGGFWEVTTASCVDYPQQQQLVELVDNRDGTMSVFATTLDHASPAAWREGDYSQTGLASLSRQLAGNAWMFEPETRIGSHLDRNTELLLPAPFDLSTITDAQLEQARAGQRARLAAYRKGRKS